MNLFPVLARPVVNWPTCSIPQRDFGTRGLKAQYKPVAGYDRIGDRVPFLNRLHTKYIPALPNPYTHP